jgi:hypothetical protein
MASSLISGLQLFFQLSTPRSCSISPQAPGRSTSGQVYLNQIFTYTISTRYEPSKPIITTNLRQKTSIRKSES